MNTALSSTAEDSTSVISPAVRRSSQSLWNMALWPAAIFTMLHVAIVQILNGNVTNDHFPVYHAVRRFLDGVNVYNQNLTHVDPHYLYPASGTLLLSPIGMIEDYQTSRLVFSGFNMVCVIIAVILLLKLFDISLSGPALPGTLTLAFLTESVTNTLVFGNINGFIVLCEIMFLFLLARKKLWLAGIPIGLTLAIKPLLAPLLFLPLVRKQFHTIVVAGVIPVLLMAIAWPMSQDPAAFVSRTVPYLGVVRDYFNSSFAGLGVYYGLPDWFIMLSRISIVLIVFATLFFTHRALKDQYVLWLCTMSGVILTGVFLVGSLGQLYYSITLIPLFMTVVSQGSFVRNGWAWASAFLIYSPTLWFTKEWPVFSKFIEYVRPTVGWCILLTTLVVVAASRAKYHSRVKESDG